MKNTNRKLKLFFINELIQAGLIQFVLVLLRCFYLEISSTGTSQKSLELFDEENQIRSCDHLRHPLNSSVFLQVDLQHLHR